jgi:uncharacterized short protein YbdD (DUF466 family)
VIAAGQLLRRAWQCLRHLSGDDAYERYCVHQRSHPAGCVPLTRAQFYAQRQDRKWSGVSRCC